MVDPQAGTILFGFAFLAIITWLLMRDNSEEEEKNPSLADLGKEMRAMEIEQDLGQGIISGVVPKRREKETTLFHDGTEYERGLEVRVDIPSPREPMARFWLPIPDELNGRSKMEKFEHRDGEEADDSSPMGVKWPDLCEWSRVDHPAHY